MLVHRLGTRCHPLWDGAGAAIVGGRWNAVGTPVIYAAASLSLAMLERLAQRSSLARTLRVTARIPEDVAVESILDAPPADWRAADSAGARAFGTAWARERRTAVLLVPSVIVPEEADVVINPAHPDFARIAPSEPAEIIWDRRLFGIPNPGDA